MSWAPISGINRENNISSSPKQMISLDDFGGATDNIKLINAFNALPLGSILTLPPRDIYITQTVYIPGDMTIIGNKTRIIGTNVFTNKYECNNIKITGITFDGEFIPDDTHLIYFNRVTNLEIENCVFQNHQSSWDMLGLLGCIDVNITSCRFTKFGRSSDSSEMIYIGESGSLRSVGTWAVRQPIFTNISDCYFDNIDNHSRYRAISAYNIDTDGIISTITVRNNTFRNFLRNQAGASTNHSMYFKGCRETKIFENNLLSCGAIEFDRNTATEIEVVNISNNMSDAVSSLVQFIKITPAASVSSDIIITGNRARRYNSTNPIIEITRTIRTKISDNIILSDNATLTNSLVLTNVYNSTVNNNYFSHGVSCTTVNISEICGNHIGIQGFDDSVVVAGNLMHVSGDRNLYANNIISGRITQSAGLNNRYYDNRVKGNVLHAAGDELRFERNNIEGVTTFAGGNACLISDCTFKDECNISFTSSIIIGSTFHANMTIIAPNSKFSTNIVYGNTSLRGDGMQLDTCRFIGLFTGAIDGSSVFLTKSTITNCRFDDIVTLGVKVGESACLNRFSNCMFTKNAAGQIVILKKTGNLFHNCFFEYTPGVWMDLFNISALVDTYNESISKDNHSSGYKVKFSWIAAGDVIG